MIFSLRAQFDQRDQRRACRLRQHYGRRRWLLSWLPLDDRRWLARLSCPELAETVEAVGRTRCEAIALADLTLSTSLALGAADSPEPDLAL